MMLSSFHFLFGAANGIFEFLQLPADLGHRALDAVPLRPRLRGAPVSFVRRLFGFGGGRLGLAQFELGGRPPIGALGTLHPHLLVNS